MFGFAHRRPNATLTLDGYKLSIHLTMRRSF